MTLMHKDWRVKEQIMLLKRLGTLLDEGYAIHDALGFIAIQLDDEKKRCLQQSIEKLKNGENFYRVLEDLNFHPVSVSFVFYGNQTGQLSLSMQTAARVLTEREERKKRIQKLLIYPVFLLAATGGMFLIIGWYLLPQFIHLYRSFQAEPNAVIKALFWFREHPFHIILVLASMILINVFCLQFYKRRKSSFDIQVLLSRLPLLGRLFKLWNTYYIAYHLSQLLKSGLSIFQSLQFMGKDPNKSYLEETVKLIENSLLNGESFPSAAGRIPFWKEEFATVIEHGQLSGKIDIELEAYSDYCLEIFFELLEMMIRMIQPLIFFIIAFWIIMMYFSIMLPSFQIINYI